MAAVEVTISGVLFDKLNRTTQNVVLIGEASLTGLGVGGGPMPPGPGNPPGIWGPNDPRPQPPIPIYPGGTPNPPGIWGGGNVPMPSPPISNVPGAPGYRPPGDHIWGGGNVPMPSPPISNVPGAPGYIPPSVWPPGPGVDFPSHPIVIPPPVDGEIPIPPGTLIEWKPVWTPDDGWQVVGIPQVPHPAPSS